MKDYTELLLPKRRQLRLSELRKGDKMAKLSQRDIVPFLIGMVVAMVIMIGQWDKIIEHWWFAPLILFLALTLVCVAQASVFFIPSLHNLANEEDEPQNRQ